MQWSGMAGSAGEGSVFRRKFTLTLLCLHYMVTNMMLH